MEQVAFVIGGARSGKSAFAESLALETTKRARLVYVATAVPFDQEMEARIAAHRERRGGAWELVEAPSDLALALWENDAEEAVLLVDCLSVWIGNLLAHDDGKGAQEAIDAFVEQLAHSEGRVVVVSCETGLGIVPDNALARHFRDMNGILNQRVAQCADEVFFVAAGLATRMKPR